MKNIHLLPTDKPSRLWENWESKLILHPTITNILLNKQHVYITSDEEIKERDWFFEPINNSILKLEDKADKLIKSIFPTCKKITLTTDQDLIKDGVQAINDEFLEWFVKNPSCEEVKIIKVPYFDESGHSYLLIIPKEEPKQETLEEVAENELRKQNWDTTITLPFNGGFIEGFQQGAKWQQKQDKNKYSEEDMKQFGLYLGDNLKKLKGKTIDEIFEEFKKK